jgi:hypothetical protein
LKACRPELTPAHVADGQSLANINQYFIRRDSMDKETVALIIAQNGLKTATLLLTAKVAKLEKQLAKAGDDKPIATKLIKEINKTKKLSAALSAADDGLASYLTKTDDA